MNLVYPNFKDTPHLRSNSDNQRAARVNTLLRSNSDNQRAAQVNNLLRSNDKPHRSTTLLRSNRHINGLHGSKPRCAPTVSTDEPHRSTTLLRSNRHIDASARR